MFTMLNAVDHQGDSRTLINLDKVTYIQKIIIESETERSEGIEIAFSDGTSQEFFEKLDQIILILKNRGLMK